ACARVIGVSCAVASGASRSVATADVMNRFMVGAACRRTAWMGEIGLAKRTGDRPLCLDHASGYLVVGRLRASERPRRWWARPDTATHTDTQATPKARPPRTSLG